MAAKTTYSTTTRNVIFAVFAVASTVPVFLSSYFLATTIIRLRSGNPSDGIHPRLDMDLAFAILAVVVSLMGSVSIIWRVKPLAITCGTTIAIAVLLFLVTNKVLSGSSESEMDSLEDYPRWFRNFVLNDNDWGAFQRYAIQEKFCQEDGKGGELTELFLRGGCCYPPDYCGYQEMNKTWTVPKSGRHYKENNCLMWSNDVDKMCYYCNTCKAAYLYNFGMDWLLRWMCMSIAGIIWVGCYAFLHDIDKNCQGTAKAPTCEP